MKKIRFTKMVATGNDFVVVDNRSTSYTPRLMLLAKRLCDRRQGIGADGLLVVEKSKKADFKMRIFNPDASEPDMCGNGSRCIALYARVNKIASSEMTIETKAGLLSARVDLKNNQVKINMTDPRCRKGKLDAKTVIGSRRLHCIDTGVPHAICFVDDIKDVDVNSKGKIIRYHNEFMPEGTNVDFVQIKGKNSLFMRTYERGVEGETFACGTGAVASAILCSAIKGFTSPVKVRTKGGILTVYFKKKGTLFSDVFLEGEAKGVFRGELKL